MFGWLPSLVVAAIVYFALEPYYITEEDDLGFLFSLIFVGGMVLCWFSGCLIDHLIYKHKNTKSERKSA